MFVTANQFNVFIACVAFGAVFSFPFFILRAIYEDINSRIIKGIADIIVFAVFSAGYILFSYYANFPSVRFYMPCGVILGAYAAYKSFYIILAKRLKKLYNKIELKFKRKKTVKNENDGRKIKKSNRRRNGGRGASLGRSFGSSDISVRINRR